MKKIYKLFIATILVILFSGCGSKVEYMHTLINNDTECMIIKISDKEGVTKLVIPSEIEGLPVTAIEMGAFSNCTELKSVELPESLETIGMAAFSGCTSLTEVKFNEGLKEISAHAFSGCTSLGDPELPEGLEKIDQCAFDGCAAIKKIKLPESLTEVGHNVFRGCTSLVEIESWGSMEDIPYGMFMNCTALENITYPENLKSIGNQAFSGCTSIKELTALPETLKSIGLKAFENCTGLTSIYIPAAVQKIVSDVFSGSLNIQTIKVSEYNKVFTSRDINGNEMNVLIEITDGWRLLEVGNEMPIPEGVDFAIPEGVNAAYEHAFDTCKNAKSIKLPDSYGWTSTLVIFNDLPELTTVHAKSGSPAENAVEMMGKTFVPVE